MFAYPLGLLALVGIPVVLGLHLFRRRFRPRRVSALFLWLDENDVPVAGRRRERLRSSPSLWLELASALLLALALAAPRGCAPNDAPHLVVVLDASASMGAVPEGGSLLEGARALVRARLDTLPADGRVSLIASGLRPRLLAGPAVLKAEARERLGAHAPGAVKHDLAPAVQLALELAGGAGVLLVTDRHDPEAFPAEVEAVALGRPADNVAIVHATRAREREGEKSVERALVTLTAFTSAPLERTLVVSGPRGELARRTLRLAPERREHVAFPLPEGYPTVRVHLVEKDALVLDDSVLLAPVPPRTLALGSALSLETARRLGLAEGDDPIARLLALVPDATRAVSPRSAHLVLAQGAGAFEATTWSLTLAAQGDERSDLVGPFLRDRRHALLEGTTLEGLVWSIDPALALPGAPLITAGDLPILTEEVGGGARRYHLNLDPARSSLQQTPDWAILLANLAELRRAELPGPERTNLAVGETFVLNGATPGTYRVVPADGGEARSVPARDTLFVEDLEQPGEYAVFALEGGATSTERAVARFAVAFQDPAESDLRRLSSGKSGEGAALARIEAGTTPLQALFCALLFVLLLLDWWVLQRGQRRLNRGGQAGPESG